MDKLKIKCWPNPLGKSYEKFEFDENLDDYNEIYAAIGFPKKIAYVESSESGCGMFDLCCFTNGDGEECNRSIVELRIHNEVIYCYYCLDADSTFHCVECLLSILHKSLECRKILDTVYK